MSRIKKQPALKAGPNTASKISAKATPKVQPPSSKQGVLIALLKRPQGATLDELMVATGWQRHSVHGTLSGVLKKKLGLPVCSEPGEQGRTYRIHEAKS